MIRILVFILVSIFSLFSPYIYFQPVKKTPKYSVMAIKNLGEFSTPNDDYVRAPIAQPNVRAEQYEINPNLVTTVQQNQFGGSASEDACMHLHTFTAL